MKPLMSRRYSFFISKETENKIAMLTGIVCRFYINTDSG